MKLICLGKYGPYPAPGGASTGYLLQHKGINLLLDCGAGVFSRMLQYCSLGELSAVILSHLHVDHCSDMRILRQALAITQEIPSMDVYLPAQPREGYEEIAQEVFGARAVQGGDEIQIGDLSIYFYEVTHPIPCNAVKVECGGKVFVFSGDSNWDEGLIGFAKGADLFVCDAAFFERDWAADKPHMSAKLAARTAKQAGVKRLLLTHIIPGTDEAALLAEAKEEFAACEVVQEGEGYCV